MRILTGVRHPMRLLRRPASPAARLAWPRRTVRLRFTVLYGGLFLLCGAALLTITNSLASNGSGGSSVRAARGAPGAGQQALAQARDRIQELQAQLAQASAGASHRLLAGSAIALGIMAIASVVLGWFAAGRVLRPLRAMTATARRISASNLHERLAVPGPVDELKNLGDTIDDLLGRLEAAFAAQRRFVADASHELRTPLATMRASLDVAMAKPGPVPPQIMTLAGRLRTELDRADQLLDGLLALARAQHGALPGQATLLLGDIVSAAMAARSGDITARRLTVQDCSDGCGARVEGSQPLLSRMVSNVIDNAVRHNHAEGWIRIAAQADGTTARLVVENGGQVLDHQQVAQLTEPFRRLGAERTGSDAGAGLGLSIVAAIAEAHGGTLGLHARAEGGLRVTIQLPLATGMARVGVPA
jgi:hypothetical protein